MMGNRAAQGKTLVSSGTVKNAKTAAKAVKAKLPALKGKSKQVASHGTPKLKPVPKTAALKAQPAKKSLIKAKVKAGAKATTAKATAPKRRK
jgi:hypothetical protein